MASKPKSSQVLVKVLSSGVCHSDIHLWEGGYEGPGGQFLKTTDRGVKYPVTPGHEIAGKIESIAAQLRKNKDHLARTANLEMGKAIKEARSEVEKCAWAIEYFADNGKVFSNDEIINTDARKSFVTFQPISVIGSIMPWGQYDIWRLHLTQTPVHKLCQFFPGKTRIRSDERGEL